MKPGTTERRIEQELVRLRDELEFRTLETLGGKNLVSNDYLGLAEDPRLKRAVVEAIARAKSVGSTGSRLLSGNSPEWEALESTFAEFAGTQSALYFGSGYAANLGLLGSLLRTGDLVFSDALNHASLIDGIRLSRARKIIYPHGDLQFLEEALGEHAGAAGRRIIVTETLFSMEGDIAPLTEMASLARRYGADLVIDEAHATGTCGPEGRGIAAHLGLEREMLAIVHTASKALGSAGAFVCGRRCLKDYLVNRARTFIFSTAMPPYMAGQIEAALELARNAARERDHLHLVSSALREGLRTVGLSSARSSAQIVPIMLGSSDRALKVAAELEREGFAVRAIRPPTVPRGTERIRVSLTAKISLDDIRHLLAALDRASRSPSREASPSAMHA